VAAIERALADTSIEARAKRTAAMTTETWSARVAQVARTIDEIAARSRGERARGDDNRTDKR
jgi:hypothetical protein